MLAKRRAGALRPRRAYDDVLRCLESLPGTRQQGPRGGARWPFAGFIRPMRADPPGDRRQAGPVPDGVGDPDGRDLHGTEGPRRRRHVQAHPAVQVNAQTGCVISFASFRSTIPPPANTLFGRRRRPIRSPPAPTPRRSAAAAVSCTRISPQRGRTIRRSAPAKPWVEPEKKIETPYVSVPGLLTAQCSTNENATFLEVTVHGNPSDARADDISGDLGVAPKSWRTGVSTSSTRIWRSAISSTLSARRRKRIFPRNRGSTTDAATCSVSYAVGCFELTL